MSEKQSLQKHSFCIGGMYCVNCQNIIEKELKKTAGIQKAAVNYRTGYATVTYETAIINFDKISVIIENLGYQTLERQEKTALQSKTFLRIVGTLVVILALFMLLRTFTTSELAAAFPLAQEGMGYGMLLPTPHFTGVHCIAMCGGINLSQTLRRNVESGVGGGKSELISTYSLLLPSILYNGGRLVSYTAIGVLVGALGSVFTISGHFQGVVQLIAGVFMLIMGINMLGLFPVLTRFIPQMPKVFAKKIDEQKTGRSPLVVGLLNGLMPCGPLQAMQVYALSTGSPIKGGISMFLFCTGTIPLMFALGAASSALSGVKGQVFSRRIMQAGAILVAALGLVMFSNGWSLSGFTDFLDKSASFKIASVQKETLRNRQQIQGVEDTANSSPSVPIIQNGVQIVNSVLRPNRYPAITVQQNIPVRWTINAPPGSITGCNYCVIFYEYGIEYVFKQGDNVIEFTPIKAGKFHYSCWMGMIISTITVLAEAEKEG